MDKEHSGIGQVYAKTVNDSSGDHALTVLNVEYGQMKIQVRLDREQAVRLAAALLVSDVSFQRIAIPMQHSPLRIPVQKNGQTEYISITTEELAVHQL